MWNLEHALDLDIRLISEYPAARQITDRIFDEIAAIKTIRKKARTKEVLKLVILNLWVSHRTGLPIKYPRNKNKYATPERYGKLFIRYSRLFLVVDALTELAYIQHKTGFLDRENNFGRVSRFWPSRKMVDLFQGFEPVKTSVMERAKLVEVIHLKNDDKNLINYEDQISIEEMRRNLKNYNEFIGKQLLEVVAPAEAEVNLRFLKKLEINVLKGVVEFNRVQFTGGAVFCPSAGEPLISDEDMDLVLMTAPTISGSQIIRLDSSCPAISAYLTNHTYNEHHSIPSMEFINHTATMTKALRDYLIDLPTFDLKISEKLPLSKFGLDGLDFRWTHPYLHRVFNQESFKLGGRFFGGFHLELLKKLRKYIRINGESTVEADYSALHIRMLYHLEGLDYRTDPYVEVCERPEDRGIYKLVLLILINAETEKEAVQAIRQMLRNQKVYDGLTDRSILTRLSRFKTVHPSIAKYLNTGIGRRLQNLDSRITDLILSELTQREVPCLPVHDSYIVPRREQDFLLEVMVKAYRDVMNGFEPEIDIKGSSL